MHGVEFLLGDLAALEPMAEVAHHARPLGRIAQETASVQLLDQMAHEIVELALGGGCGAMGLELPGRRGLGRHPPFVAEDHHGLG